MNAGTRLSVALLLTLGACSASVDSGSESAQNDSLPASTPTDQADTSCRVALTDLSLREAGTAGNYMTECDYLSSPGCSDHLEWFGSIRVARDAVAAGAQVFVLYRSSDDATSWKTVSASLSGDNEYNSQLYDFRFPALRKGADDGTQGIELIPFLAYPNGSRLFDHNVVTDRTQSYHIGHSFVAGASWTEGWQYSAVDECRGTDPSASIQFKTGWKTSTQGKLVQRGDMKIDYDAARFTQCQSGAVQATVEGYFEPTGLSFSSTIPQAQSEFTVHIPAGATKTVMWFRVNCGDFSSYDSNFGKNFSFAINAK
jgi:hypothetical protein